MLTNKYSYPPQIPKAFAEQRRRYLVTCCSGDQRRGGNLRAVGGRRGGGIRLPRPRRPLPVLQPPPLRQGHPRQVARAQCSVASVHYYRRYCREFPLVLPPPSAAWPGLFLVTASHPSLGYSEASLVIETLRQYLSPVLTVCVQVAPASGPDARRCSPSRHCPSSPRWCRPWPGHRRWGK